jgi:arylsulfatase A-like enzyme
VRRRALRLAIPIGAALAALSSGCGDDRRGLPAHITVEEIVADLSGGFGREAVIEEPAPDAVRPGVLQPGMPIRGAGARASLVTPPRSRLRFRVAVPRDAALLFAVGVEGAGRREEGRSGLRFSVSVGEREVYRRLVDPAATRHDRRWFEERVELGAWAGRAVDIVLAVDAEDGARRPAGLPGWSHVRVVRETTQARQPAGAAPNVLVVLVDTLRADRLGCHGARPSPSPTLDRLAATGLLFEVAVAQSSWTLPSVASLFTGLHPRSHGAVGARRRDAPVESRGEFLADGVVTWAEEARRAGIATVGVSANPLVSRATNLAQGFETFIELPWDAKGRNWTAAEDLNRAFLDWLAPNRGYRFVAYLHYMEPHDPYTPPPALRPPPAPGVRAPIAAGWIRDAADAVNWRGAAPLAPAEIEHVRRLYDGEIRAWDGALAALLAALERLGLRETTLIVLTSDHGEEFQEHGRLTHGAHLYEESIRVPLVLAGPGIEAGRRADPAQGIDLFPTLAGVLGIGAPAGLPGRDLLATREVRAAVSETARGIAPDGAGVDLVSLRAGGWKLIHAPALDRTELYDLGRDPGEREDASGTGAEGARLRARLAEWAAGVPGAPPTAGRDRSFAEKLRALGYVE